MRIRISKIKMMKMSMEEMAQKMKISKELMMAINQIQRLEQGRETTSLEVREADLSQEIEIEVPKAPEISVRKTLGM